MRRKLDRWLKLGEVELMLGVHRLQLLTMLKEKCFGSRILKIKAQKQSFKQYTKRILGHPCHHLDNRYKELKETYALYLAKYTIRIPESGVLQYIEKATVEIDFEETHTNIKDLKAGEIDPDGALRFNGWKIHSKEDSVEGDDILEQTS